MRHFEALKLAYDELIKVENGLVENNSGDLIAMDIRQVLIPCWNYNWRNISDELLGNIFANFCIGK